MPHFGLVDEERLGPVDSLLLRARLHVRGGRRRLRDGRVSDGIATLHDALGTALRWYVARVGRAALATEPGDDPEDERSLHALLVRSGVLDGRFDLDAFARWTERALEEDLSGEEVPAELLAGFDAVLTRLGVLPFDEGALPPEVSPGY